MDVAGTPGTTYFVDATGGNDGSAGTSESAAWQTIAKVNAATFGIGDTILFKRGETWSGTQLDPPSSGISGHPIVFGAYGSGALPIIDGNDTVNCCICRRDYVTFQSMRFIDGLNFGLELSLCSYVNVIDCEADGCGNDNVLVDGAEHVEIARLTSTGAYERVAGPAITCLEIIDGSHDVEVYDCTLTGSENHGMSIHSHAGETYPYNIHVHDVTATNNTEHGIQMQKSDVSVVTDRNVLIEDCVFSNNSKSGVVVRSPGGARMPGITVQDCVATGCGEYPLYIIQSGDVTLRRCVFDGTWQSYLDDAGEVTIQNCTFYRPAAATIVLTVLTAAVDLEIKSCILSNDGATIVRVDPVAGIDMDYNLYYCTGADPVTGSVYKWGGAAWTNWAGWKSASSQDANSTTPADPLFTDVASKDFTLQAGSPARGAGEGGVDCGAYPYTG
jgi:hypothetical protein